MVCRAIALGPIGQNGFIKPCTGSPTCRRLAPDFAFFPLGYRIRPQRYHLGVTKKREVGRSRRYRAGPTRGGLRGHHPVLTHDDGRLAIHYLRREEKAPRRVALPTADYFACAPLLGYY